MKIYCVSAGDYDRHAKKLQALRLKGNMILLYGDCSRTCMMREHYRKANIFAADNGEFVFSGCRSLYDVRSAFLEETLQVLKKHNVSYAFRTEDPSACGGTVDLAVSDPSLPNDTYTYLVRFSGAEEKDAVQAECLPWCTFHFLDGLTAYLIFNDSSPRSCLAAVQKATGVREEEIIFADELSD